MVHYVPEKYLEAVCVAGGWQWRPDEDFSVGWELCSRLWVLLAGGGTEAQSTPRLGVEGEAAACALGELGLTPVLGRDLGWLWDHL